ncbi:MAG: PaaI family thioesterase [Xanthobacteraceae bacterium]|nr:PaaI family thioesterase [Xanthobacteraceae bacterium]
MTNAKMSVAEIEVFLRREFPQAFGGGDIQIETADGQTSLLRQPYNERMLRPGGTISGPTLMAMADFAMYVVLLSAIGPVGLAVTTNLNINFFRKGQPGQDILAAAKLMKIGKRLAFGEVQLLSGTSPDPIAHATATYSIPSA